MQHNDRVFLSLLQAALTSNEEAASYDAPADELFAQARNQSVASLIYPVLANCEFSGTDTGTLYKWAALAEHTSDFNLQIVNILQNLIHLGLLRQERFILLKGAAVAQYYPYPLYRSAGDVDLYISPDDRDRTLKAFKGYGMKLRRGDLNSYFFEINGVVFEIHSKLIDVFNIAHYRFGERLAEQTNLTIKLATDGLEVRVLPPVLMHLQLSCHILKHYMGFGLGLKQFCDVAMVSRLKNSGLDWDELGFYYSKLGLTKWAREVYTFCIRHLALPGDFVPERLQRGRHSEKMLLYVLSAGNFGFYRAGKKATNRRESFRWLLPQITHSLQLAPTEAISYPFVKLYNRFRGLNSEI